MSDEESRICCVFPRFKTPELIHFRVTGKKNRDSELIHFGVTVTTRSRAALQEPKTGE